jgi:hypothetical protein
MMKMTKRADISPYTKYRWTLLRVWAHGPQLCWVMLNPSTADHQVDDQTILRAIHFTRSWGYSGFTVVNLYPFRSPKPADCRKWAEWEEGAHEVLRQNADLVARHAKAAAMVVAAWGNSAWDAGWTDTIVQGIIGGEEPWPDIYCLGMTGGGAPKHPMARGKHRVPDDQQPTLWRSAQ